MFFPILSGMRNLGVAGLTKEVAHVTNHLPLTLQNVKVVIATASKHVECEGSIS